VEKTEGGFEDIRTEKRDKARPLCGMEDYFHLIGGGGTGGVRWVGFYIREKGGKNLGLTRKEFWKRSEKGSRGREKSLFGNEGRSSKQNKKGGRPNRGGRRRKNQKGLEKGERPECL